MALMFAAAFDLFLALALRDNPSFLLAGLGLRRADGRRASRWRCALRTTALWLPVPILFCGLVLELAAVLRAPRGLIGAAVVLCLALLIHLVTTFRTPNEGLVDRFVGTRVVLR